MGDVRFAGDAAVVAQQAVGPGADGDRDRGGGATRAD
jgi:hypothetical protein